MGYHGSTRSPILHIAQSYPVFAAKIVILHWQIFPVHPHDYENFWPSCRFFLTSPESKKKLSKLESNIVICRIPIRIINEFHCHLQNSYLNSQPNRCPLFQLFQQWVFRPQRNSRIILARILGSSLLTTFIHEKINFKSLRCNYKYIDCLILKRIQKQKQINKDFVKISEFEIGFFVKPCDEQLNRIETKIYI